jgi:hypothetical protein
LKREFDKCTNPVIPMANSTEKKDIKTGVSNVPNPKPEKKVRTEAAKATAGIRIISICTKIAGFLTHSKRNV